MQQPVSRTRLRRSQTAGPRSGPRSAAAGALPPGTLTLPGRPSALAGAHPVPVSSVLRISTRPYCGSSALPQAPARAAARRPPPPDPFLSGRLRTPPWPRRQHRSPAAPRALGAEVSEPPAATRERRRGPADAPARGLTATAGMVWALPAARGDPRAVPGRAAAVPGEGKAAQLPHGRAAAQRPRTCCGRGRRAPPRSRSARPPRPPGTAGPPHPRAAPLRPPSLRPGRPAATAAHLRGAGALRSCPRPPPCLLLLAERGCSAPRLRGPGQVSATSPAPGSARLQVRAGPTPAAREQPPLTGWRRLCGGGGVEAAARTPGPRGGPGCRGAAVHTGVIVGFFLQSASRRIGTARSVPAQRETTGLGMLAISTVGGRSGGRLASPGEAPHRVGKSCTAVDSFLRHVLLNSRS